MNIVILDDYQDAVRKLQCASKLEAYPAKVFTNTVKGIGQLSVRLRDADVIVLIRERTAVTRQLVEKLKGRANTAGISVILLASKADITEKLSSSGPVDDFVEKPFFLKEATQRIKRVIDKIALEKMAKKAPSDGVLRGSLLQMNVIDLVQSLEMGRKSCALTLTNAKEKCEMFFQEGQVTHAAYGPLTGDGAVFKVLRWTSGNFQIDFEGKTTKQSTTLNTQGLLMEGLRLLDESKREDGGGGAEEEEDVLLDT